MSSGAMPSYRLGVDVGGTFTDLLLINEQSGETCSAKVPSTPKDSSIGVLNGVAKICEQNKIDPQRIIYVMHGTTALQSAGQAAWLLAGRHSAGARCTVRLRRRHLGGTMEELKERCKAETGFDPPCTPRFARWMGRAGKAAA